jgi:hypothetical protein
LEFAAQCRRARVGSGGESDPLQRTAPRHDRSPRRGPHQGDRDFSNRPRCGKPELASRIVEEGANLPADVFFSEQNPPIASSQEKGLLAATDTDVVRMIPAQYCAKDGTWVGVNVRTRVVAYNKKLVTPAGLPKSIMEFAAPALKGRFGYASRTGSRSRSCPSCISRGTMRRWPGSKA